MLSHVGILGNEKADAAAKSALSLPVTRMKLPGTDMMSVPGSFIRVTGKESADVSSYN